MLCKACDANYANAILVEGICDECNLQGGAFSPSTYKYCGVDFSCGLRGEQRKSELLTNEVALARVMKKYKKARDLGALSATNQIAALNERLADFYKKEAEVQAKEAEAQVKVTEARENDRRLAAILGENIRQTAQDEEQRCTSSGGILTMASSGLWLRAPKGRGLRRSLCRREQVLSIRALFGTTTARFMSKSYMAMSRPVSLA